MVIIIGIISGIITSLGLGGGAVLIIGLTLLLGIEQQIAQSVNLIFFIPTAITAIILNSKRKTLKRMFGGFLGIIAIYEIYTLIKENKTNHKNIEKLK